MMTVADTTASSAFTSSEPADKKPATLEQVFHRKSSGKFFRDFVGGTPQIGVLTKQRFGFADGV